MKDFEKQWQRREEALQEAQNNVPSDEVILNMAKKAQIKNKGNFRWIPYVAAACLFLGVMLLGTKKQHKEPKFLCNSGCSVQEVIVSANRIVNQ